MSNKGLYFYKLISKYPEDQTLNCKLSINQIDSNFETLKDADISAATFVRGEDHTKSDGVLFITKNDGEQIIVPIDTTIDKNLTYDFNASAECGDESGVTLTINYKDDDGEKSMTIENILTADNLINIVGSDILTKVIIDNTLKGMGTMSSPLGLADIEKTGMLAPAIRVVDLTSGGTLPEIGSKGARYITKEIVNDYGFLYNGSGVEKIQGILDAEYESKQIYKEVKKRSEYWHVPTKSDWDKLLNSIEPCDSQNHHSAQCHVELGKVAGKYLKSACGWVWQEPCVCNGSVPNTGSCPTNNSAIDNDTFDDVFDSSDVTPSESDENASSVGVDKYGMAILPSGIGSYRNGARYEGITETAYFWTSTEIERGQDVYVKVFDFDKGGVWQVAECPDPYYSVRLVKDYDGSNYRAAEYINGILYEAILFPESKQIWLASNFADKKGFITLNDVVGTEKPELLPVNGGHIIESRVDMFINEYNGRYWERKVMNDGDTIVIQNPCFDKSDVTTVTVCWVDDEGVEHPFEITFNSLAHENGEYRVCTDDENTCNKILVCVDDFALEKTLEVVGPMIAKEKWERMEADAAIQNSLNELSSHTLSGLSELTEALSAETIARINADNELAEQISEVSSSTQSFLDRLNEEIENRIAADEFLSEAIDDERNRAIEREDEIEAELDEISGLTINTEIDYQLETSDLLEGNYNLILKSKDGNPEHFIKIKMNSDFGEI